MLHYILYPATESLVVFATRRGAFLVIGCVVPTAFTTGAAVSLSVDACRTTRDTGRFATWE